MESVGMKRIALLGASGSIGRQTLDIIESFPDEFTLVSFSVGEKAHLIPGILTKHRSVGTVYVRQTNLIPSLQTQYPRIRFLSGNEGLPRLVKESMPQLVVNALVGFVGLEPTLVALNHSIDVALANKEALVVGGPLVKAALQKGKADLIPIDSEHVAIDKLLHAVRKREVAKIILTASGGALYHYSRSQLALVTPAQALAHPTWAMGPKITVDSATMMNKGFEIIEAHYLFDFPGEKIEVTLHPTSKIHSMVQLVDGTYIADIGLNNMHIPISYALFGRRRVFLPFIKQEAGFGKISPLELKEIDLERFPALNLARWALQEEGTLPAVMNGANEVAVSAFLAGQLRFDLIERVIQTTMERHRIVRDPDYGHLVKADQEARDLAVNLIKEWHS